ncbi:MAG: hypothetical protein ACFFF9_17185 [Candidatus Thorarchaeota archaeon]
MNDSERMGLPNDSVKDESMLQSFIQERGKIITVVLVGQIIMYVIFFPPLLILYPGYSLGPLYDATMNNSLFWLAIFLPLTSLLIIFFWMASRHERFNIPLGNRWSSRAMEIALRKHNLMKDEEGKPKVTWSSQHKSVTDKARLQLLQFMPRILVKGTDQKIELLLAGSLSSWGGVFVRALENKKNPKERCLQYVFVYTRQHSSISIVWWVIFPLIMALAVSITLSSGAFDVGIIIAATVVLPFTSLATHLTDPTNKTRIHPATSLAIFWLILFTGFFDTSLLVNFLLLWSIFFLAVWLLDLFEDKLGRFRILRFGHPMDYIPIFVYIIKKKKEWILNKVCWDEWHYKARMKKAEEIPDSYKINNRRVSFLLDNPWHSLRLGTKMKHRWFLYWFLLLFSLFVAYLSNFFQFLRIPLMWIYFGYFYLLSQDESDLLPDFEDLLRSKPSPEITDDLEIEDLESSATLKHLTDSFDDDEKKMWPILHILWNLKRIGAEWEEEGPKFVVVSKMQNPFNLDATTFTFRDEVVDLYSHISKLEYKLEQEDSVSFKFVETGAGGEFFYERSAVGTSCKLPDRVETDSLTVTVNGVRWKQRPTLVQSKSDDTHFIVETDVEGRSIVRFGNGENGMDLPENAVVVCEYSSIIFYHIGSERAEE